MGKGKTKRNTRDLILDAAELIVDRDGVNSLTFDALAAEARVSKGTTLYHFDCKEALTSAMIERFVARFDTAWAHEHATELEKFTLAAGKNTRRLAGKAS